MGEHLTGDYYTQTLWSTVGLAYNNELDSEDYGALNFPSNNTDFVITKWDCEIAGILDQSYGKSPSGTGTFDK